MKKMLLLVVVGLCLRQVSAFDGYITLTNGYFFDPAVNAYWLPHGVACQTWS